MKLISRAMCILACSALLVACVSQERTLDVLVSVADTIVLPPGAVLLGTESGLESLHPDRRCWSNHVSRVYASNDLDLVQTLAWFEQEYAPKGWKLDLKDTKAVVLVSRDGIRLGISDDYRFVVIPQVDVRSEEKKYKTLFYVGLTQRRINSTLSVRDCT